MSDNDTVDNVELHGNNNHDEKKSSDMLPAENSDVDGNAEDLYVNDVDHHDDNCKNDVVTVFRRENINSVYSAEVRDI